VEGTRAYDEDEKAKLKIKELNKEIYRINKENIREGKVAEIYWKGRELSYQYFDDFYAKIGLKFDKYYPESTVADLGLKTVKEQLEKGIYEMSGGAIIFDGDKFGLHTRVFVNNEGVPTYEAKDVGLIFTKWEDYHFDKSVVITGNEQLDYMKVVLKSVEQYAPELVEKTVHLTHGMVKLPGNVKMSSRKGNFLKAVDILDMVAQISQDIAPNKEFSGSLALTASFGNRRPSLPSSRDSGVSSSVVTSGRSREEAVSPRANNNIEFDNLEENEKKIALSAVKYAFLKYKMGGDIIFDPKESVKMTGNSGPYLLYSTVRAKRILNNATEGERASKKNYSMSEYEKNLIKKVVQYKEVLREATGEMAPHKVCNYLYELAQEFSRFYENCPVVGNEFEVDRMKIVKIYYETILHGFSILGIEVPDEM